VPAGRPSKAKRPSGPDDAHAPTAGSTSQALATGLPSAERTMPPQRCRSNGGRAPACRSATRTVWVRTSGPRSTVTPGTIEIVTT
jgi:hypothetical protein